MDKIIVLDFGSQYNRLIARRIREFGVYSEILPFDTDIKNLEDKNVKGIILSGGPSSVYEENAPILKKEIFELDIPFLGICYGMQLTQMLLGGTITKTTKREYGKSELTLLKKTAITKNIPTKSTVWMSHGDHVDHLADNFELLGKTPSAFALVKHKTKPLYNVQFHPEVTHTDYGKQFLKNFTLDICNAKQEWSLDNFIEQKINNINTRVQNEEVILALSGGVDSSVVATLIHQAIGERLTCVFVDTGLLRKDEGDKVMDLYAKHFNINVIRINAKQDFLSNLTGITDPEQKRKVIGNTFIDIFKTFKEDHKDATFLAQGTIYPDVIESMSAIGPSETIKSHHNVGGLPKELNFELLEPLRELFKDEVRKVGLKLGIPKQMIMRHPFPGPGLGIRILGEVTQAKVDILKNADNIFIEELYYNDLYGKVSQSFAVLLPVKTVGVMGDKRTYEFVCALRSADTFDFMTATFSKLPHTFLENVSARIINEVSGINRVVYDITSKPPGTIEWE
ncbi:MAG: glutamine-hydrolyzing GMP synthase [Candidatus Izimaplasma sp.]|nr:glutamine-hydrolyzing GMP synthase [Candidatus Izimaplasma bacterium]